MLPQSSTLFHKMLIRQTIGYQRCGMCGTCGASKLYVFLKMKNDGSYFISSCSWSRLGRNRLQEKWPVVRKNHQDIHDLFILAFVAFTLQRYCGLPTRKAETSCLRKFSSPSRVVIPGQALLSVCHSRTLQAV